VSTKEDGVATLGVDSPLARDGLPTKPFNALDPSQSVVRSLMSQPRARVWLCGPAGTGKSKVVSALCEACAMAGLEMQVCASTGQAASQFAEYGGRTLHSWAGLSVSGAGKDPRRVAYGVASRRQEEFQRVQVLVLDEISMLPRWPLEVLDFAMRRARSSTRPFGGCRILAVGDFMQLAPVERSDGPSVPHTLLSHPDLFA